MPTLRFFVIVIACVLVVGCGKLAEDKKAKPAKVGLAACTVQDVERSIRVLGTLYGNEETTVAAKVPGRIVAVRADVGDRVAVGAPLVEVDPTDYRLDLASRELALRQSLAQVGLETLPGDGFDIGALPAVVRAKLQWDNAEAKRKRGEGLFQQEKPLMSPQDYADLKTAAAVAESGIRVELQSARVALAESRSRASDCDLARQRLADAVVRAPRPNLTDPRFAVTGYAVGARMAAIGEYVKEGAAVFRLVDDHLIKLRANVPERYASQLRAGQRVRISAAGAAGTVDGEVGRVSPQVDASARTFSVEVWIANAEHRLRAGGFAEAEIAVGVDHGVVLVPLDAVVSFAGNQKLFTVSDQVAHAVEVRAGIAHGDLVEVQGYDGEQPVVVVGASKLGEGMAVSVDEAPAAPEAPAVGKAP